MDDIITMDEIGRVYEASVEPGFDGQYGAVRIWGADGQ